MRIKALLLAFLMLGTAVLSTACSDNGTDDKETKKESTTESSQTVSEEETETETERVSTDLPDMTFDGADFGIYMRECEAAGWNVWQDIWVESVNGEPINDAVYNRNNKIQSLYDITIKYYEDYYITFEENCKKAVKTGEQQYHVVISSGHDIPRMYTNEIFYNLHDINYINFDKPWWDSNSVESFTLGHYLPFACSDISILNYGSAGATFYNKKLANDYNLPNLYELVLEGKWTMDKLIELGTLAEKDLNGNGISDDEDRYGIVCSDEPVYMFFHSAGGRYVSKDENNYPVLSFESEHNYDAIKYYLENIMYDAKLTRNNSFVPDSKSPKDMFMQNQALFMLDMIRQTNALREMEEDFGIIPIPKYEESQKNYASSVSCFGGSLISVLMSNQALDMTGFILEALSAESKYTLVPAFYDTVLKDKSMRDKESTAMLDIISANLVYDVGDYYSLYNFPDLFLRITGSVYDNNVNKSYPQRTSDVASFYKKYEKPMNTALKQLIKIIDKWNADDAAN